MRLLPKTPRQLRRLRSPYVQMVAAACLMVAGAWLIAIWMVGAVLMVAGLLWTFDALLRDSGQAKDVKGTHEQVLERWKQAR